MQRKMNDNFMLNRWFFFSLTDSSDIVDCKLKLILGLIWTLILHYSISMPMWDNESGGEQIPNEKGATPKQRYVIIIIRSYKSKKKCGRFVVYVGKSHFSHI